MAIGKPERRMPSVGTEGTPSTLVGNQDTARKGDSLAGGGRSRRMDLPVPERRYGRMREAAAEPGVTLTRITNDGVDMWLGARGC